ncbi:hypothetical protein PQG02_06965 [Nostoc sp. UHCC 0926]|uniref:hypothetical protein n=1 Tax=unclassified Nostoc TaxID=2593658 RepID=UPI0023616A47|nr:hypothetical protein [Nostoc sp. UHCC 0926]WDD34082.1 hypothetical protein PQG02_06965 [Nostoc sp. UHCC 0926]
MALYGIARLAVVVTAATPGVGGEPGTPAETDVYYFRVSPGMYAAGPIATATGITEVALTKATGKALTPIKELIRAGVLKTATAIAKLGAVNYRIKLHYAESKDATIGADIVNKVIPETGVNNTKSKGATFTGLVSSTRVTGRS